MIVSDIKTSAPCGRIKWLGPHVNMYTSFAAIAILKYVVIKPRDPIFDKSYDEFIIITMLILQSYDHK